MGAFYPPALILAAIKRLEGVQPSIEAYGSRTCLGECFADAERPTRVIVGLLRLTRPGQRVSNADEFDGFFLGPDDLEAQGEGLIPYRRSRDLVNRYVEACKIFDETNKGRVLPELL